MSKVDAPVKNDVVHCRRGFVELLNKHMVRYYIKCTDVINLNKIYIRAVGCDLRSRAASHSVVALQRAVVHDFPGEKPC